MNDSYRQHHRDESERDWDIEAFELLSNLRAPRMWPHVLALVLLTVLLIVLLPTNVYLSFTCYLAMLAIATHLAPLAIATAISKLRNQRTPHDLAR